MEEMIKEILLEMKNIKTDIQGLKTLKDDVQELKNDIRKIKSQQSENNQILRALEHKGDVHKATLDNMSIDIAEIKGNIKDIKGDIDFLNLSTAKNRVDIQQMKQNLNKKQKA